MSVPKEELERLRKSQTKIAKDTGGQMPPEAYNCPYPTNEEEEAPVDGPRPEMLPAKKEDVKFQVSEMYGVSPFFLIMIGPPDRQQPFVTSAGLSIKADKKGTRAIQSDKMEVHRDEKNIIDEVIVTAYLWPKISKEELEVLKLAAGLDKEVQKELLKNVLVPYTAVGTATKANTNVKMGMDRYMIELAQTRAINRAKRQFTAMGLTSVEEMPDYEGEESGDK